MYKKNLTSMIDDKSAEEVFNSLKGFAEARDLNLEENLSEIQDDFTRSEEVVYSWFTGKNFDGQAVNVNPINVNDALATTDAPVLFEAVIRRILREPKEPQLFLSNSVAEQLQMSYNSTTFEYLNFGPLVASMMSQFSDFPNADLGATMETVDMKGLLVGLSVTVPQEVAEQSHYPLMAMYIRQVRNAIDRKCEGNLSNVMKEVAQVVFDNNSSTAALNTTGVDASGNANYTFDWKDLVKMIGTLLGNKYNATHILAHPLAWSVFYNDPYLRAYFYHGGSAGSSMHTNVPEFDQSMTLPLNLIYVPYYNVDYKDNDTLTGSGSGLAATLLTDLYVIDRANSLVQANWGETQVEDFQTMFKIGRSVKGWKKANWAAKDGGRGMMRAKDIRCEENHKPLFSIRQMS